MPGCSSVWYECLVWDQEAAGSSPVIRTNNIKKYFEKRTSNYIIGLGGQQRLICHNKYH